MDTVRLARLEREGGIDLMEVFTSIQGEGPRAGERHLFVRLGHCDIHCAYCDTPGCHVVQAEARIETAPCSRDYEAVRNPVQGNHLREILRSRLSSGPHHAVSVTGGEPLLQPWGVRVVAEAARGAGVPVLLETDGNLPDALEQVIESVDVLSLDWKLPSATGEEPRYEAHRRCLEVARGVESYVKAVFVSATPEEEILTVASTVASVRPEVPLILQPCTPYGKVKERPRPEQALRFQERALEVLQDVRVLPQIHRTLDQP